MATELTADQADMLLPDRKLHVIEEIGVVRRASEWMPAEVREYLLLKAEKIERRAGTDDPYGHELAILVMGKWFFVAI